MSDQTVRCDVHPEPDVDNQRDEMGDWQSVPDQHNDDDEVVTPPPPEYDPADVAFAPSKYHRKLNGKWCDVYDILQAWSVTNPALQHLIKKALQPGRRGHKTADQDMQDIVDSAIRAQQLEGKRDAT